MRIKLILLLTVFVTLSSCISTEYIERGKYELEIGKQQLIPYQKGQKINFIHSKGYAFDFKVTSDTLVWTDNNYKENTNLKYSYYDTFQRKTVMLESDYPSLRVTMSVTSDPKKFTDGLEVKVNEWYAFILIDENSKFKAWAENGNIFHETILINGKTYNNVIETRLGSSKSGEPIRSLLINEEGIIQIKLSDDETFSINN